MPAKKRIGRVLCKEWKPYGCKMGCTSIEVCQNGGGGRKTGGGAVEVSRKGGQVKKLIEAFEGCRKGGHVREVNVIKSGCPGRKDGSVVSEANGKDGHVKEVHLVKSGGKGGRDRCVGLKFQVADVRKPLLAVSRVTEKGNEVRFGPGKEGSYIRSLETGEKVILRPNGRGSYKFDVKFPNGKKTAITVDSGAEESVCPMEWGEEFGLVKPDQKLNLINASGDHIIHYGQRQVKVEALF